MKDSSSPFVARVRFDAKEMMISQLTRYIAAWSKRRLDKVDRWSLHCEKCDGGFGTLFSLVFGYVGSGGSTANRFFRTSM